MSIFKDYKNLPKLKTRVIRDIQSNKISRDKKIFMEDST